MRIPEENRNMVLLASVTLCAAVIAWAVALVDPAPTQADSTPAYLADRTPVGAVEPFQPKANPREDR